MISFVYNSKIGIRDAKPSSQYREEEVIEMIRTGDIYRCKDFKEQIEKLRNTKSKELKRTIKDYLPFVTWSGKFSYIDVDHLVDYSGFICIDFDPYLNIKKQESLVNPQLTESINTVFEQLSKDPYTYTCFISPSGTGIKTVVKLTDQPEKLKSIAEFHLSGYLKLEEYFKKQYNLISDPSGKDLPRRCFLSYDPDTYFNPESKVFLGSTQENSSSNGNSNGAAAFTGDYDPLIKKLSEGGFSYVLPVDSSTWDKKKAKWFHDIIQIVGQSQERKIDITGSYSEEWLMLAFSLKVFGEPGRPLFHILSEQYHAYDRKATDEKFDNALNKSKFTTPAKLFSIAKEHGIVSGQSFQEDLTNTDNNDDTGSDEEENTNPGKVESGEFWFARHFTKGQRAGDTEIKILEDKLLKFYEANGFYRQQIVSNEDKSFQIIRMINNQLETAERPNRKAFIREWLEENTVDEKVTRELIKRAKTLFSNDIFEFMVGREIEFKRDTKNEAFLFFKNCFLRILPDSVEQLRYDKLDLPVWRSQIIQRDYTPVKSCKDSEYLRLLMCVIGGKEEWKNTKNEVWIEDKNSLEFDNLSAMMTAIGYLIHGFKNPSKAYTINLFDKIMAERKVANGRSGKTLLIETLQYVKKLVKIPGARCDLNKPETFSNVNLDTSIVLFDDCKEGFPYDKLFDIITGGMTVKRLYADMFTIPFQYAPKIALTSNHPLLGTGESYTGRQRNYELTNFFNAQFQPPDYFGHNLALEWDQTQWDLFYGTIIQCLQAFLEGGVMQMTGMQYERNKLLSEIPEAFIMWADDYLSLDFRHEKQSLFSDFKSKNPEFDKMQSSNKWTNWLKRWASFKTYKINAHITSKEPGHFPRDKSGDIEFITIINPATSSNQ